MKRWLMLLAAAAAIAILYPLVTRTAQTPRSEPVQMAEDAAFRITFGAGAAEAAPWDGGVTLAGGQVTGITITRAGAGDSTDEKSTWKLATRRGVPQTGAAKRAGRPGPMLDNGVIITAALSDSTARFQIQTAQGNFSFAAQDVPLGSSQTALNGRAVIERVAAGTPLTTSAEDEDFPALARSGDEVWVAFVQFVHSDHAAEAGVRAYTEAPKNFDTLSRPAGGDQVFVMRYSKASNTWDTPIAVSAPKQDVMRAAVAVDGKKRVWVIWSANKEGNFDLYARRYAAGEWSQEIRLTSDPGTDVNPVAVTDSNGRVWVAWQAFRRGNLDVLAAVQNGDAFSREQRVSFSPQSDWDPAIAAGPNGEVAVSWDTYDKGDYDVYLRRMTAANPILMEAPIPVAATDNFEARSSIAYDGQKRLWVAYEGSFAKWGKDFGAYETSGVALYQGHNIQVKCFQGANAFTTAAPLQTVLPSAAAVRPRDRRAGAGEIPFSQLPNPALAARREPSATPQPGPTPLNSFPRLTADAKGMVYLALRTPAGAIRSPLGSVWVENVLAFDGAKWSAPIAVLDTDGLLDNRPAIAALEPGRVLLVSATDHRGTTSGPRRRAAAGGTTINTDIYAAQFRLPVSAQPMQLKPLAAERPAAPQSDVQPEVEQVAAMHAYRARAGGETVQLMRGEFHRHTEISGDGGRDGPLIDAYRYMIDAAYMDWVGCCDHDNGSGHEYAWWVEQKLTDAYKLGTRFVPMFAYERSVRYPEGHRNVVFPTRGIRPLPRLPKMDDDSKPTPAPDTQMLYRYLRQFGGIVASHTSGTDMGTDWRDNDPALEPVVEIYQGDRQNYEMPGAPRSNNEKDSIGGWRPLGFVSLALQKGYRLGFQASSDHISTHMSYCNLWVTKPTREGVMEAFRKRRVYGSTDNILADVRCGEHFMGEEFTVQAPPSFSVRLKGTAAFSKVHIIKDNQYVYTAEPKSRDVNFNWKDNAAERGKTSYYYVRGEQQDGELVWVSPMWIHYQ